METGKYMLIKCPKCNELTPACHIRHIQIDTLVLWQLRQWVFQLLLPVFSHSLFVSHTSLHGGFAPLSTTAPHSPRGRGYAPCTPLVVFRLPSRSLWVVVAQRERSSPTYQQRIFRNPYNANALFLQGFSRFS